MARISSNWKITFDPFGASPIVLLDFGDLTEGEVVFPYRKSLEVVDITEGSAPFMRLNGNSVASIEYERYTAEATDAAARTAIMDSLLEVESMGKKPLKVEINGVADRSWIFTESVVGSHESSRWLESAKARLSRRYTINATGILLQIATPGSQNFGDIAYGFGSLTNTFGTL